MSSRVYIVPPLSECVQCHSPHGEPGLLCAACRKGQMPTASSYLQGTIATALSGMRRWANQGHHISGALGEALVTMQRAYDLSEPQIREGGRGHVTMLDGEVWAFPPGARVALGPFGDEEAAQGALTRHAADSKDES